MRNISKYHSCIILEEHRRSDSDMTDSSSPVQKYNSGSVLAVWQC